MMLEILLFTQQFGSVQRPVRLGSAHICNPT
jgi:hypothetical protein